MVGQGLELAETGQQSHFEVHLVDMAGDPFTTEQQVTAELRSLMDSSVTPASVVHKTPDIYEVSYQPNTRGRHKLSVVVNDEPVQGSPFLVYVRQAPRLLGRPVEGSVTPSTKYFTCIAFFELAWEGSVMQLY